MLKNHVRSQLASSISLLGRFQPWQFGRQLLATATRIVKRRLSGSRSTAARSPVPTKRATGQVGKPNTASKPDTNALVAPVSADLAAELAHTNLVRGIAARGIAITVAVLSLLVIWGLFALAFHVVMPERWAYLTAAQLDSIRTYVSLVLASGLLSDYARRLLGR